MHKKISKFFLQFRTNAKFEMIRAELESVVSSDKYQMICLDKGYEDVDMEDVSETTVKDKVSF